MSRNPSKSTTNRVISEAQAASLYGPGSGLKTREQRAADKVDELARLAKSRPLQFEPVPSIEDPEFAVPEIPGFKLNNHTHKNVRDHMLETDAVWRPIGRTSSIDMVHTPKGVEVILLLVEVQTLDGSLAQGWVFVWPREVALTYVLTNLRNDRLYSFKDKYGGNSSKHGYDQTIVVRSEKDLTPANEIVVARMKPSKPTSSGRPADAAPETIELETLIHYTSLEDRKHEIFAGVKAGKWQTRYCSRGSKGASLLLGNARLEILDVIQSPKGLDLQASYRIAIFTDVDVEPDIVVVTRHKLFSDQDTDFQKKLRGHGFEVGKDGLNVLRLLIDVQESHQFRERISAEYSDPTFKFSPLRTVDYVGTTGYVQSADCDWFDAYVTPNSTILADGRIVAPEEYGTRLAPVPAKYFETTTSLLLVPTPEPVLLKVSDDTAAAIGAIMRLYGRDAEGNVKTVLGGLWGAAMATRIPFMFQGRRTTHSFVAVVGITGASKNGKTRFISTAMLPFNSRSVGSHDYEDMALVKLTPQPRRDLPTYYGNSPCLAGDLGAENDKSLAGKKRREVLETHVSDVHDGSISGRGHKNGDNELISGPTGLQIVQAQYSLKEAYSTGNESGDKIASRLLEFSFDWKIDKHCDDAELLNLIETRSLLNALEPKIIIWAMNKTADFFAGLFVHAKAMVAVNDREGTLLQPVIYGLLCWKAFLSEMGVAQFDDELDAYIEALNKQTASQQFFMEQTALEERELDRADDILAALKMPFIERKAHIVFDTKDGRPSPGWLKQHDLTQQEVGWDKNGAQGTRVAKGYEEESLLCFYQPSLSPSGPLAGVYNAFAKHDQILKRKELTAHILSHGPSSERERRRDPITGKAEQFIDTSLDWMFPIRGRVVEDTSSDPTSPDIPTKASAVALVVVPSVDTSAALTVSMKPGSRTRRRTSKPVKSRKKPLQDAAE